MNLKVVVTGSSGGIGSAVVKLLIQEDYDVIGLDIVPPSSQSRVLNFFKVDLRKSDQIDKVCYEICNKYPSLWAVIHCAGFYPIRSFEEYNLELWDEVNAINLRSVYQITKILYSNILKGGRIAIIASGAAHIGSRDVGYSSSKAGVVGLVRSLAKILALHDILVNAVCPGVIETPMSARMSPDHINEYLEKILLRRSGSPEEVAICTSFLLNKKNSYMTGASIDINGGLYLR